MAGLRGYRNLQQQQNEELLADSRRSSNERNRTIRTDGRKHNQKEESEELVKPI